MNNVERTGYGYSGAMEKRIKFEVKIFFFSAFYYSIQSNTFWHLWKIETNTKKNAIENKTRKIHNII